MSGPPSRMSGSATDNIKNLCDKLLLLGILWSIVSIGFGVGLCDCNFDSVKYGNSMVETYYACYGVEIQIFVLSCLVLNELYKVCKEH